MKKLIAIVILTLTCYACGSSKGHCDAYGNKSGHNIDEDVQQNS